jgi:hypothetical protein
LTLACVCTPARFPSAGAACRKPRAVAMNLVSASVFTIGDISTVYAYIALSAPFASPTATTSAITTTAFALLACATAGAEILGAFLGRQLRLKDAPPQRGASLAIFGSVDWAQNPKQRQGHLTITEAAHCPFLVATASFPILISAPLRMVELATWVGRIADTVAGRSALAIVR